jgi:hypothetical protein
MAGILTIGGPDTVKIEQIFPSTQKTYLYNFNANIAGWSISADYQTLVVDTITFDRSGNPSFDNSQVIGFFPKANISGAFTPTVTNAATGEVKVYIPGGMYQGNVIPDARQDIPVTVVGITWADNSSPPQINTHRWAFIQNWEPGVPVGDPKDYTGYQSVVLG